MISYFPTPYEDEILASLVARYHSHVRPRTISTANAELYGMRHQRTSLLSPTNISGLHGRIGKYIGMTQKQMINELTLFPYDFAHTSEENRKVAVAKMLRPNAGKGKGIIRVSKRGVSGIKLCPDCQIENTVKYGEPYWHRSHQIDGAHYCWQHGVQLQLAESEYSGNSYKPLEALKISTKSSAYLPSHSEKTRQLLIEFSRRARAYLDGTVRTKLSYNFESLGRDFFLRLYPYQRKRRNMDISTMERDFIRFFGEQFLEIMNLKVKPGTQGSWFRSMFRHPEQVSSRETRKHIVMSIFIDDFLVPRGKLFPKTRQLLDTRPIGPWLCPNPAGMHNGEATLHSKPGGRYRKVSGQMALFSCACGFEFSAVDNRWDERGQPVPLRIRSVGTLYIEKCKELSKEGWPKAKIADFFNVDIRLISQVLSGRYRENYGAKLAKMPRPDVVGVTAVQAPRPKRKPRVEHFDRDPVFAALISQTALALSAMLHASPPKSRVQKAAGISNYVVRELSLQYPLTIRALDDVANKFALERKKKVR